MPGDTLNLFINPTAGRGRAGRRLRRIEAILRSSELAIEVTRSRDVGDLESSVRQAVDAGVDKIIVAGGDGSIHEAVNGIMAADGTAALGVIPVGTGNDFAKACSIPLDWELASEQLAHRLQQGTLLRHVDLGRMNSRYFANGAGIGFDAKVTSVARGIRWPLGDVVYLFAVLRCLLDGVATPEMTISGDGCAWTGPVTLANISNGPWVGGMFHIAPMADNADGHFDLLLAEPVTRRRILALLPLLIRGRHLDEPEIHHHAVRRLHVSAEASVPSHLDGEVQPLQTEFTIDILPASLGLL